MALRIIKGKLSDIAAWCDPTEGGELVNVRQKNLPIKLLTMVQAQLGWRQGCLAVQKNTPRLIDLGNALQQAIFTTPHHAPPPDKNNTVAIIAAYINSDLKLRGIIGNIKKITPYCGKIIIVDLADNLTASVRAKLMATHDHVHLMTKDNSDLLDFAAWQVGLANDAAQGEYFLLVNDGFFIFRDIKPFFEMAIQDNGQHDRYGILEVCETLPAIQTNFTLLNKRAKDFLYRYIEQTAPMAVALLDKKRKAPDSYYEFYRKSISVYMYEYGIARHLKSRALFSFRQDARLKGINLLHHDAMLFREYLDQGFPLFHWKQLKRRSYRPLIEGYMPPLTEEEY